MALEVKTAVGIALTHVADLFSDVGTLDLLLEEVDTSKDGVNWLITVSFVKASDGLPSGFSILGNDYKKRQYKVVKINKASGAVTAVKMRAKVTPEDVE